MLGLARRAGRLSMGHDTALDSVRKRKARLIVFSGDISQRVINEFSRESNSVPCVKIEETIEEIHIALGYKAGVITVNDDNFASRIAELINQEVTAYDGKN